MQRANSHHQQSAAELSIHSYWSEEDGVFLAEVEGVPGTLTHSEDEHDARRMASELAQGWVRIENESKEMTLAEFKQWMHLSAGQAVTLGSASSPDNTRRSLREWNRIWTSVHTE